MKYLSELIQEIKKKSELKAVDNDFIANQIQDFVKKYKKIQNKLEISTSFDKFKQSKEHKLILKSIRADIRKAYILFQLDPKNRIKLFTKLKISPNSLTLHKQILETHRSTKERIKIYPKLYNELFKITGNPASILDLGCGLNPFSYPWMKLKDIKYIAVELNKPDLKLIEKYFKLKKINGKTYPLDLVNKFQDLNQFKTDICFLFKLLDSLEVSKKNITEKILENINSRYIIASFATKSVGGKIMQNKRRKWFEFIAKTLDYEYTTLEFENEIFYILNKN